MLKEIREKQMRLATNARAKLSEITDDTPAERAAEIEREFDAIMAEHDALEARAKREERLAGIEGALDEFRESRRPNGESQEVRGNQGEQRSQNELYTEAFTAFLRSGGDHTELSNAQRAALRAGYQQIKEGELRTQTVGTAAAGGYTVPTELSNTLVKSLAMWGPMYDAEIVTEILSSNGVTVNIPTVDDTSKTGAIHTEGADIADDGSQDVTFGQKSLSAYVYDTEFIKVSMELLQDSVFPMESLLDTLLGERIGRLTNTLLTTGDGSSKPLGIVSGSSLGVTAASATAITSDELIDLVHSVNPAYRQSPKTRFMFNDTTLKVVRKLKDGQGNYLWQMGDVTKGVPGSLLGHNYSINQAMANVATGNKSVVFGDFSKFWVRKVGGIMIGVLRERFWPQIGMAGLVRFDGELVDTAAIKHLIQS